MRGRRGTRGKGRSTNVIRSPAQTAERDDRRSNSRGPPPSSKRKQRQNSPFNVESESSGGDEEKRDYVESQDEDSYDNEQPVWRPDCGVKCKRHEGQFPDQSEMFTHYSHFPRDHHRVLIGKLFSTLLVYVIIFPFVNCIWTYYVVTDEELVNLFTYITANPRTSFRSHVNHLSWLQLPNLNAESLSLILAIMLKNAVIPLWGFVIGNLNFSVTDAVVGEVARRFRH